MYLKSITLKGFKSFPDRTTMEFGPGTSVIVGPNGSGKSNVTDAVLWVLGEQSPVAVRGQTMSDVIFGGAPGRQASSAAEVELVLDDPEGTLGMGPEVSIMRRLDRNGDGEYRLGGAKCRLTDVQEVLSDTGLGKEMHSVISQGRVEAIVTSKPKDRRLLIEEAAGLGKHRKRRRRTQLKLGHTQENLDRALDVEREARSRLKPLKRQAEAAELHARVHRQTLEARWELARDDTRLRRIELTEAVEAAKQAHAERERLEQELSVLSTRRGAAEEALAARSTQREQLSRRAYSAQSSADRVSYRADAVVESSRQLNAHLERSRSQLATLQAQAAADRPDPEAEGRVAALSQELSALEEDREAELARQLRALESERVEAAEALTRAEQAVTGAEAARRAAEQALEEARGTVREAERAVDQARRESARVGGELAAVNQFLRSHQGAPGGGKSLADVLEVSDGDEHAVAALLDGRLSAALAASPEEALALLERTGASGGRVLLPHGEAQARDAVAELRVVDDLASLEDAFQGIAVTRDGRAYNTATGELWRAPAAGEERVLAERNRQEKLLAESEQAARAEQAAKAEAKRLAESTGALERDRDSAVSEHRAAINRRDEAAEQERRLSAQIERRRSAPPEGEHAGRIAQLRAELRGEQDRSERLAKERAERERRIQHLQASIASGEALAPEIEGVISDLRELAELIAARRAEFDEALRADREAGEQAAVALRQAAQEEAALQNRLNSANNALTNVEVRRQRAEDQAREAETVLAELASELELAPEAAEEALAEDERQSLNDRLARLAKRREQIGPVNPLAEQEYQEALEHVEELEKQREDLENALRELEKLIRETDQQIRETFQATFDAAAANFEELAPKVFPGGSGRLRLVQESDGRAGVIGGEESGGGEPPEELDAGEPESGGSDDIAAGVEIEITPAGKAMKRLTLLSGGEKSMTALAFLFAVFLARPCPFYIMDEVEAALDDLNISRFLDLLDTYSTRAQFIVVTHQKRTMEAADSLYGVSMGGDGISKVISRRLPDRAAEAA